MPPGLDEAAIFLAGILVMLGIVGLEAARREVTAVREWDRLTATVDHARSDFDER